jgi:hypothetical protein
MIMESKRKKWTAREEVNDSLLKFREKRKWQVAFRRYVLERNISQNYAQYFGLDIENYRKWVELQFTNGLNWENFGTHWQFDHIIPVSNFDFSNEEDLKLCWNFINLRVEKADVNHPGNNRIDILGAKSYFEELYNKTSYQFCLKMVEKIKALQESGMVSETGPVDFINQNKEQFEKMATLSREEFMSLNKGISLSDILLEREILRKFG